MKTFFVVLCFLVAVEAQAQVSPVPENAGRHLDRTVFGLGLSAGVASGFGLSFRQHFPSDFSYQIVGGIIKADTKLHYNIGMEVQYDVVHGDKTRYFVGGATGYFYSGPTTQNDLSGPFRLGGGIGGEWSNVAPFHLAAEVLFTYFSDGTVLPLPQVSCHYYFF